MDSDRLMTLHYQRELAVNDKIVFKNVGSYTMSLSPLFIEYFPYVYVYDGYTYKCVREKWGVKEYVQKCYNMEEV